jgi:hypothetical protein
VIWAPGIEQDSVLFEEAFVNPFDHIRLLILHANIVTNHQCAEFSAVDQDDSGGYPLGILDGFRREPARSNEDALSAWAPCRAPTNSWISGRLTGLLVIALGRRYWPWSSE